ncbi:AraC family transcriptional regulator [Paenibacillus sp. GP183]|jgi:AraC family transcriptional regulator|uniref:AraC family transcriptional regulator n=1 Tax=Paenibacillus sp. GP183 TaxID=1882751 RepID=UPI000896ED04|nr:AraC family transcriptional regulator [Paenibacillus sp. GP183]SEB50029.1 AraC-type DNA-binding protein [Paenibacillus sp. GP183]
MHTAEIVQQAIDYIEENLNEPLGLEQIAEAAAMSVPNLYRMFYAMTGHPIKEYIRKRRTNEAAFLLRQTDLPTIDVGFGFGFDTYQTFIKTFKRYTGLTPGLYRKSELIYSFERINLHERVPYFEDREVSERYPDVRVIRLTPQKGVGYLHTANREDGLEDAALSQFRAFLAQSGLDANKMKLFGLNINLNVRSQIYGYQIVAVSETEGNVEHPDLRPVELPGGLYAVTRTPAGSGSTIIAAWNLLLSEWLPRSTFELGEHGFLEEYQQYCGKITRLKLFLPVRRRQETETIEVVERPPVKVISFRAEGINCAARADEASVDWLIRSGFVGDSRLQVFMTCSYGIPPGESYAYEVSIGPPEGFVFSQEEAHRISQLKGGIYACLRTGAYGTMTGILERIYRWLGTSTDYVPDGERSWYAYYVTYSNFDKNAWASTDFERSVNVECYVPVILRKKSEDGP